MRMEIRIPAYKQPVNRGSVPGFSFPPRALAAARLGPACIWKGILAKKLRISL
jgi:hypothetical protein